MSVASGFMNDIPPGTNATAHRRARRRPGENRERLIQAGIVSFAAEGYHRTSTTVIASLANVPQPHVYASFRTKQQLFLACASAVSSALVSAESLPSAESDGLPSAPTVQSPIPSSVLAAFMLQWIAVSNDERLQPELGILLAALQRNIGRRRLLALISSRICTVLDHMDDDTSPPAA